MVVRSERPGGGLATRPLHFIWIADASGSMASDGKIQSLNNAIRETIPHLRQVAESHPFAQMLVRCIAFSTGVRWHIREPTPVEDLAWKDLRPGGYTHMGEALQEVATELSAPSIERRALPPALILISDGQPTDDFQAGLDTLLRQPWGRQSVRLAIAIGRDADVDVLRQFMGDSQFAPVAANNPEQLVASIRWASVVASRLSSEPTRGFAQAQLGLAGLPDLEETW